MLKASKFQLGMVKIWKDLVNLPICPKFYPAHDHALKDSTEDSAFNYMQELMTMGVLCMEFEDTIQERDGLQVLRVWKFLLLIFKAGKRYLTGSTILVQYYALLWSRFINTSGKGGGKGMAIGNQSSNLTPKVLT